MDVRFDDDDIEAFFREAENEVVSTLEDIGEEAVQYAVDNGTYHDVTGNLRRSNKYEADKDGLTIYNDADYATDVEQRGHDVISGAILFAEKRLKEEFGL